MGLFDIFFSDDSEEESDEITVNLNQLGWYPDAGERVLVAHGDCKLMKNGGKELGNAFGKTHFIAQESSSQRLVCCVTNKRMILIPQDDKEKAKTVFSISSRVMGVDWASRKMASSIFFNNWLEFSVKFSRDEIVSAKLSEIPVGNIVMIKLINNEFIYLGTTDIGHSADIMTSIMQPEIFMD